MGRRNAGGRATKMGPFEEPSLYFVGVHPHRKTKFLKVAEAPGADGLVFGLALCRQQHRGQYRNDGDNDQQFDQSEAARTLAAW